MATTTDIRQWAREQGLEVKDKGPVSPTVREQYDQAHADPDALYMLPDGTAAEGGRVDVAATAPHLAEADPPPAADPRQEERTPTRPPRSTAAAGPRTLLARFGRAAGKDRAARPRSTAAGKRRAIPRVSLAGLIEDAWGQMAFVTSSMPPMQRLLQAQGPYAGIALEDALAGTIVDRALQPIARAEDKAKAVGGLVFPPMALMLVMATAPVPRNMAEDGAEPVYVWPEPSTQHKGALLTLRWSLMLWSEAGAARLEAYQARAQASAERGAQADRFMAWILGAEDPGADPAAESVGQAVSAEDEAIRRAQEMFGG